MPTLLSIQPPTRTFGVGKPSQPCVHPPPWGVRRILLAKPSLLASTLCPSSGPAKPWRSQCQGDETPDGCVSKQASCP